MKNPIVASVFMLLILAILSDSVAAFLAGRVCWRLRKRAGLALPFALVLFVLAFVSVNDLMNYTINLTDVKVPPAYLIQAFAGRALKAGATWYLALKLLDGSGKAETIPTMAEVEETKET